MRHLARAADRVNGTSNSTASSRTCIAHPAQLRRPPILGWRRCATSFAACCRAAAKSGSSRFSA